MLLLRTIPAWAGEPVDPTQNGPNRMRLTDGRYVVMVRKDADGSPKNWILTAFEREIDTKRTDSGVEKPSLAGSPNPPLAPTLPGSAPKINDDTQLDLIDMIVDPDGIVGNSENPGAMSARDAAKVASRDDFMVERFRGCII